MRNYIFSTYISMGIGLNQFFPDFFVIHVDTRTPRVTNTRMGSVSSQAFKQAASFSGKVRTNGRKNTTHGK